LSMCTSAWLVVVLVHGRGTCTIGDSFTLRQGGFGRQIDLCYLIEQLVVCVNKLQF